MKGKVVVKPTTRFGIVIHLILAGAMLAALPAHGTGQDHPLLSRMPGFHVDDSEEREFDSYDFRLADGTEVQVEGHLFYIDYGLDDGERVPSELQILRNHTNAIEAIGGEVLFTDGANAFLKATSQGLETWVHVRVYNQATAYSLHIIERQSMVQKVEANAESMARDLLTTGRTAIYGIYFDFDRADIKPESEPTLSEIARLLREQPDLRLHVVGHTDNIGQLDYNMDLSRRRAVAVVEALASTHAVAGERLRAAGVGPLAPAAPNTTEEGRARNRRVELVAQ
jgi:outer membrane protein OmpA-like peptidoglycan-associated protein